MLHLKEQKQNRSETLQNVAHFIQREIRKSEKFGEGGGAREKRRFSKEAGIKQPLLPESREVLRSRNAGARVRVRRVVYTRRVEQ